MPDENQLWEHKYKPHCLDEIIGHKNLCKCGCNQEVKKNRMFVLGHHSRLAIYSRKGKHHTEESKLKLSKAHQDKRLSEEHKKKISNTQIGRPATIGNTGKHQSDYQKQVVSKANKDKLRSEETKAKISRTLKGHIPWNRGIPFMQGVNNPMFNKHHSNETKLKMSLAKMGKPSLLKGVKKTKEHLHNLSKSLIGRPAWNKGLTKETDDRVAKYGKLVSDAKKGKYCGDKSPNWKGGIAFLPYCPKFNRQLKEKVRQRDNHTCQLCSSEENGHKHHIHHIHYDKENCYPDLITLCNRCHSRVNYNRPYYESFFINNLNNRSLLLWRLG